MWLLKDGVSAYQPKPLKNNILKPWASKIKQVFIFL